MQLIKDKYIFITQKIMQIKLQKLFGTSSGEKAMQSLMKHSLFTLL